MFKRKVVELDDDQIIIKERRRSKDKPTDGSHVSVPVKGNPKVKEDWTWKPRRK